MKKILVLTDLQDAAATVAKAAVPLSSKINANILLIHTWVPQPVLDEYPNNSWGIDSLLYGEQCKEKLDSIREQLNDEIALLPADVHHAHIDWQQDDGSVKDCAADRVKKGDIEIIIIGASASSPLDHLLLGSNTYGVISNVNRPVLVVPAEQPLTKIDKVTFATDFSEGDVKAVHYLTRLGRKFDFKLEIVHVSVFGKDDSKAREKAHEFQLHVAKFNYKNISYETIYGKNITDRLQNLCDENESDLLALSHDRHSFWNKLLKGTQSGDLLKKQRLPVLIIPAELGQSGL